MSDLSLMNDGLLRNLALTKPVIAAVNGAAVGAGAELLQATDLRLIVQGARIGLPEVQRGLIPGGGSVTRLIRQIPWALAAELLLLGEAISAERAAEIGLVNEVVQRADLLPKAQLLADRLARNGPLAVQAIKEGMLEGSVDARSPTRSPSNNGWWRGSSGHRGFRRGSAGRSCRSDLPTSVRK